MRTWPVLAIVLGGVSWLGLAGRSDSRPDNGWKPLFNGRDLSGWTHFFNGRDKGANADDLVRVEDGVIHIYPEGNDGDKRPFGYILTAKEYSHYHLRCEYKWGMKRFGSKAKAKRDSGVLYHVVGPDKVWPRCVECQVQEGDTGDIFTVGTRIATTVDPAKQKGPNDKTSMSVFLPPEKGGLMYSQGTKGITRVVKSETAERDGWNTVELIVKGDSATQIVNGKVVNRCTDIQQSGAGDTWVPLTAGRIAFQAEGAEVFYRNIEIKE
ncbi:MAG TPA: DUF1080 domain-containing protein [Gemmataceae bacterium]|jgi:hypothetical protein